MLLARRILPFCLENLYQVLDEVRLLDEILNSAVVRCYIV